MKVYRTQINGHLVETRVGDWGGQEVLLDGKVVSKKSLGALTRPSHHFDVSDGEATRHVEVQVRDLSRLGLGRYRVIVLVDGVERCRLKPIDPLGPPGVCANCGYSLEGQPVEHGELRCPECGRHTPVGE